MITEHPEFKDGRQKHFEGCAGAQYRTVHLENAYNSGGEAAQVILQHEIDYLKGQIEDLNQRLKEYRQHAPSLQSHGNIYLADNERGA